MDLSNLTRFRLRRVNPYRGLVVDENTWAEAHDYHRDHLRLHALAFHSAGVIAGLEVSPLPSPAGVEVSPGVAMDPEGNMLVIGQERKVPFEEIAAGDVYIVASYQENRVNADAKAPRGAPPNRIVESYKLEALSKLPEEPCVELARVRWTGATAVRLAGDPASPREDEIDLCYRPQARAARPIAVNVGIAATEAEPRNARGISNLLREIDNVAGYQAVFRGYVNLDEGVAGCNLIYMSNAVETASAVSSLASHLSRGGAVLADNCKVESETLKKPALQLAEKLGLKLAQLAPGDPLLDARFPFSEPPGGANDGELLTSGRFVLSLRDYGCAWSGACGKEILPRETVRSALEWGVNLAILSAQPLPA